MDKTCEGVTFRITHESTDGDGGNATVLQRIGSDSTATTIPGPDEMRDYAAVGLGCAIAESDKKPYFVVQYGELPFGCEFCEWFYLYDASGKQLTRSDPALITDPSLPEGQQQSANTREYEATIEKIGLTQPEVEYIE